MDHNVVVRDRMTEKYLLDELDPEVRDKFEEHYFDCAECARDVRAGYDFVAHSKLLLAESSESVAHVNRLPSPVSRGWFSWLRPAFAAPVLAMLLAVIGFQNLITYPQLKQAINKPQLLPATTINLQTYGANGSPLVLSAGESFLLNVIIPPGHRYTAYKMNFYNPAGGVESVPIPASADDTWPIRIPGTNLQSGTYKVTVFGVTRSGEVVEVGSNSVQLQIQR